MDEKIKKYTRSSLSISRSMLVTKDGMITFPVECLTKRNRGEDQKVSLWKNCQFMKKNTSSPILKFPDVSKMQEYRKDSTGRYYQHKMRSKNERPTATFRISQVESTRMFAILTSLFFIQMILSLVDYDFLSLGFLTSLSLAGVVSSNTRIFF